MAKQDGEELIHRRSLHSELVDRVRELIVKGDLVPGEKIPEKELCVRFGVSRTPMREALKVLAAEGIVSLAQHRGATVRRITSEEAEEVFPIIGALEALSGKLACARITDAELRAITALHKEMVACWKRHDILHYFQINREIHEAILEASQNSTLINLYRGLADRVFTARYVAGMSEERWSNAVSEHEEILAALEQRDSDRLERVMERHLATKLDTVRDWLIHESDPQRKR